MSKAQIIVITIISVLILIGIIFIGGVLELEYAKFFFPKREAVERKVFEESQSYVHGKIQDLAKYYEEYKKAESANSFEDRNAIENLIKMNFSDFDAEKIQNMILKNFLIKVRGY